MAEPAGFFSRFSSCLLLVSRIVGAAFPNLLRQPCPPSGKKTGGTPEIEAVCVINPLVLGFSVSLLAAGCVWIPQPAPQRA